ncbi:hypothetical protein [Tropicibacter naphthalenivorans]|nr:hypothetical protein [Tropicibacter naphthalenivorans]
MSHVRARISPENWLRQMFTARAAAEGGVVRRKTKDIDRIIGRERFLFEIDRRGYTAVENAGQIIVFCNRDPVRRLR